MNQLMIANLIVLLQLLTMINLCLCFFLEQ
jgi:hypothetical protein